MISNILPIVAFAGAAMVSGPVTFIARHHAVFVWTFTYCNTKSVRSVHLEVNQLAEPSPLLYITWRLTRIAII